MNVLHPTSVTNQSILQQPEVVEELDPVRISINYANPVGLLAPLHGGQDSYGLGKIYTFNI